MKLRYFLFFLTLLCGCQKNSTTEQVVRLNFHSEPASLDPRLARDLPSLTICRMLYEGLFRPFGDVPRPALAHSFTISEDKRTYTFELHHALWSDGSVVTAQDFVTSWQSTLAPDFPSESAGQLFTIKGAKEIKLGKLPPSALEARALGPTTLEVTLTHPDSYFIERLCHPVTYPIPSNRLEETWHLSVANGPFRLSQYNHGDFIKVEQNSSYWDKEKVRLSAIFVTFVEDEHTELNMYENNELDWAGSPNSSVPPEAIPTLQALCPDELFILPLASTYCYKFNTKAPPFNNDKIREAFSLAIERETLIDNILQAGQLAACQLIPPSMGLSAPATVARGRPRTLFEQGLEEMGWTRQTMPPVTLMFSRSEKHQKVAQAIQQQWSQTFGIKVALQSYEWNVFLSKLAKGEYQVGGRGWISELADPKSFLELYKYDNEHELGGGNDTGWEDAEFIRLLDLADQTTDEEERKRLIAEAQMRLVQSCAIAPVYHSTACYLKKPELQGVQMNQLCDLDFKNAYLVR